MTTVFLAEKQCFACGTKSQYPVVDLNLSIIGPRDLDGRPAMIQRSSVYLWVQRCLECGYCAPEITQGTNDEIAVMDNHEYKVQLQNEKFPETANTFLCHAMIMEHSRLFADAGWAAVFAAWICDDNGYIEAAFECRGKAIEFFRKAKLNHLSFGENPSLEQVYFIDLLRRRGEFNEAGILCDKELDKQHDNRILDLFCFERELIDAQDIHCHNDTEAAECNSEDI